MAEEDINKLIRRVSSIALKKLEDENVSSDELKYTLTSDFRKIEEQWSSSWKNIYRRGSIAALFETKAEDLPKDFEKIVAKLKSNYGMQDWQFVCDTLYAVILQNIEYNKEIISEVFRFYKYHHIRTVVNSYALNDGQMIPFVIMIFEPTSVLYTEHDIPAEAITNIEEL